MEKSLNSYYHEKKKRQKLNDNNQECNELKHESIEESVAYTFVDMDSDFSESDDMGLPLSNSNLTTDNSNNHNNGASVVKSQNATSDNSSSEEECTFEAADSREIRELQEWVRSTNTPHNHVDKLLKILRRRLVPSFPKNTKTLLKCKVNLDTIDNMTSNGTAGEFKYFGTHRQIPCNVTLRIGDTSSFPSSPAATSSPPTSNVSQNKCNSKDHLEEDESNQIPSTQKVWSSLNKIDVLESVSNQKENRIYHKLDPPNAACLSNINKNDIMDAPVIHFDNVECKTQFETAVIMKLDQLSSDLTQLLRRQDTIAEEVHSLKLAQGGTCNFPLEKLVGRTAVNFEEKHNLKIPLVTYQDFELFEEKLQTDKFFKSDVYNELQSLTDKEFGISRSIVKMLKKFFTKELGLQFTAIRSSPKDKTKYKFRPSQLCAMMEVVIVKMRSEKKFVTEQEDFNGCLSDVFTNVNKWRC